LTSGGSQVGAVRSRTKVTEFILVLVLSFPLFVLSDMRNDFCQIGADFLNVILINIRLQIQKFVVFVDSIKVSNTSLEAQHLQL
jgi:hypothetical protein